MSIYVVGSTKNTFMQLDNNRTKFLIDVPHEGENIDFLNPWYCELTGLYYMWQHCMDNIVGLEHYRRYFVGHDGNLLMLSDIKHILDTYDIIMRRFNFPANASNALKYFSNKRKPYLLMLVRQFDNSCKDYIFNAMNTKTYFAACNMFVCSRSLMNEYCYWLFKNLAKIPLSTFYSMPRLIGYLAEFVFGYWIEYKNRNIFWGNSITI